MKNNEKPKDPFNIKEIREILDCLDRPIAFRRVLVDLTGSVPAALMLSQAIYWQERATQKDGWWYKTVEDWEEETGLSRYKQETARKKNRKYLLSDLRDAPARLYWKVDRDRLKSDLMQLHSNNIETSARENLTQDAENPPTSFGEIHTQAGEKHQTSLEDSRQLARGLSPNINMYTESTSENTLESNPENKTEIKTKITEVDTEIRQEEENRLLLRLINSCVIVLPEENQENIAAFITKAVDIFTLDWVRDAINESVIRNKRNFVGVLEILNNWKEKGHTTTSRLTLHNTRLA
jgi:DnaD/phage-associated family protein